MKSETGTQHSFYCTKLDLRTSFLVLPPDNNLVHLQQQTQQTHTVPSGGRFQSGDGSIN